MTRRTVATTVKESGSYEMTSDRPCYYGRIMLLTHLNKHVHKFEENVEETLRYGTASGYVWARGSGTVSYTHLTLPTKRIV